MVGYLCSIHPAQSRRLQVRVRQHQPFAAGVVEVDLHAGVGAAATADAAAGTALMNLRLQGYIDTMPSQYYWVHKRFKDRPSGEAAPY